jgi:hypothetical protein
MGRINFEDRVLIKRRWADKKMNVIGRKFKDRKKRITVKNNFHFLLEVV